MPVLRSIRERFAAERPLDGRAVAACLHVTAETANLVRALVAGGRRGRALRRQPARRPRTTSRRRWPSRRRPRSTPRAARTPAPTPTTSRALVAAGPHITLDDGADLVAVAARRRARSRSTALLGGDRGDDDRACCALRALEAEGRLPARSSPSTRRAPSARFNDRYGTGQSVLDGILRATNILLAGRSRRRARLRLDRAAASRCGPAAPGAPVIVCEVDPMRALEARMEGFEVMPALEAAERGDVFITVTGSRGVLRREHFARMKDGAVLANAGHFDVEIDLDALRELRGRRARGAAARRAVRPRRPAAEPAGSRARREPRGRPRAIRPRSWTCRSRPRRSCVEDSSARAARRSAAGRAPRPGGDRSRGRAAEARRARGRASTS